MREPPPRESAQAASLSGDYLADAVDELDAMGDPDALYGPERLDDSDWDEQERLGRAPDARLRHGRNGVLFAAFAAEAYINEFSSAMLSGADREALDRSLSPPMRYLVVPKYATGEPLFSRDDAVMPEIFTLFRLRNDLAHPKPGFAPRRIDRARPFVSASRGREYATRLAPQRLARHIVAVAQAARLLNKRVYGDSSWIDPAEEIALGRDALFAYADAIAVLPPIDWERPHSVWELVWRAIRSDDED